jgi:hypothetical protein
VGVRGAGLAGAGVDDCAGAAGGLCCHRLVEDETARCCW